MEDKDFGLTRWLSGDEEKVKFMRRLLLEMTKGVIEGSLDRF